MVARVLGERRICKLQVDLTVTGFQYTVYCVEHEPVSHALQVMAGVVSTVLFYLIRNLFVFFVTIYRYLQLWLRFGLFFIVMEIILLSVLLK